MRLQLLMTQTIRNIIATPDISDSFKGLKEPPLPIGLMS